MEIEILFCGELYIKYQYLVMKMIENSCFFGENLRNRIPDIDKTFSRKKYFLVKMKSFFPGKLIFRANYIIDTTFSRKILLLFLLVKMQINGRKILFWKNLPQF